MGDSMAYSQDRMISLPNELWSHIFDDALLVPGALSIDYDEPFDRHFAFWNTPINPRESRKIIGPTIINANAFALQLMLVSKLWHDLAITKLYRHLRVRSERHLSQLALMLASKQPWRLTSFSSESGTRTLGSLVRRLDIVVNDSSWPTPEQREVFFSGLYSLLELMPSLKIFECAPQGMEERRLPTGEVYYHKISMGLERSDWEKIGSIIGPSLRRLELETGQYIFTAASSGWALRELLRIFPRLCTVDLGPTIFCEGSCWLCHAISPSPPIALRSLTLKPSFIYQVNNANYQCGVDHISRAKASTFPDLSRVSLHNLALAPVNGHSSNIQQFIHIHGPKLSTVYLYILPDTARGERIPDPTHTFQVLQEHCPHLSGLVLESVSMFGSRWLDASLQNEMRLMTIQRIPRTVIRLAIAVHDTDGHERVVCWLAASAIRVTSIRSILLFSRDSRTTDIWTGLTTQTPIPSSIIPDAMEDGVEQDSLDVSPEDLFSHRRRIQPERFYGALKRLADWGIQVDFSENLST